MQSQFSFRNIDSLIKSFDVARSFIFKCAHILSVCSLLTVTQWILLWHKVRGQRRLTCVTAKIFWGYCICLPRRESKPIELFLLNQNLAIQQQTRSYSSKFSDYVLTTKENLPTLTFNFPFEARKLNKLPITYLSVIIQTFAPCLLLNQKVIKRSN